MILEAAKDGDVGRVKQLARDGAPVNWADTNGITALHVAAGNGHLAVVRCLVKELNADVNQALKDGDTPLYIAAHQGHVEVVRCLVDKLNADVNQARENGDTPVAAAAANGHDEVVRVLVRRGADIRAKSSFGNAAARASPELAAWLESRYCANPGCDKTAPKKCTKCQKVFWCSKECLLAHWPVHKKACRADRKRRA